MGSRIWLNICFVVWIAQLPFLPPHKQLQGAMSLTHIWLVIAGFLYIEIIILAPGSEYLSSTMAHLFPGKASGMYCISPHCPGRPRRRIRRIHPIMKLSWKQACVWLLKYNHRRHNQIRMPCICTFHHLHWSKMTISKCDQCVVWLSSASST